MHERVYNIESMIDDVIPINCPIKLREVRAYNVSDKRLDTHSEHTKPRILCNYYIE